MIISQATQRRLDTSAEALAILKLTVSGWRALPAEVLWHWKLVKSQMFEVCIKKLSSKPPLDMEVSSCNA